MPRKAPNVRSNLLSPASLCSLTAGLYGGLKHGTASKFFLHSGVNSGIVAVTFFSIREYVVSPLLVLMHPGRQYQLRRQKLSYPIENVVPEQPSLSWTDIRMSRLLDSGASGGLAGGILNAWKRGRHGVAPGFATGALACTVLQWCFNEFNILRIRYVSTNLVTPIQHTAQNSIDATLLAESSTTSTTHPSSASNLPIDRILSVFGKPISDEKYLERLKLRRDSYLRRIAELEEEKKH